nr:MAG TPA: hypothetical protein [Caudoviricetes sp.]
MIYSKGRECLKQRHSLLSIARKTKTVSKDR